MESLKLKALEGLIKWFTGGGAYELIKKVVDSYMDADMTGAEKLAKVKEIVYPMLKTLSGVLINLAIEVAVFVLQAQAMKK